MNNSSLSTIHGGSRQAGRQAGGMAIKSKIQRQFTGSLPRKFYVMVSQVSKVIRIAQSSERNASISNSISLKMEI